MLEDLVKNNSTNIKDLLAKVNKLVNDSNAANATSAQNLMSNVAEQLTTQKEQIEALLKEQEKVNIQLAEQQETMLKNADKAQTEKAQIIMKNMQEQLNLQKEHIGKMLDQQSSLNKVLLGDMQDASANHATSMREGVLQQMEQYKKYADELANKQLKEQKTQKSYVLMT